MSINPKSAPKLLTSNQTLTAGWVNLGAEINCEGALSIALWIDLDVNNSTNVRIRALARNAAGGSDYVFPIKTTYASNVKVQSEYIELDVDADQKIILETTLDGLVPFVQFQVMAEVAGVPAGIILSANRSAKY